MISLARVTRMSGGVKVLDDITLRIAQGECVRITGEPGSGRTTLLRLIGTLIPPTSGELLIDGVNAVTHPTPARRRIGYVSAEVVCGTRLRVDEYLEVAARTRGTASGRRVVQAVETCRLDPGADIGHLSVASRLALAMAATLVTAPPVVLIDELAAVDEPSATLLAAVREHRERGATLVIACDAESDLSALSSRIVTLERGRVRDGLPTLRRSGEVAWAR